MIDIVDNSYGSFPGSAMVLATPSILDGASAHALPFFEFMMSDISKFRARLGSKFWGSTAFSRKANQLLQVRCTLV
jgi:hypothetical protein